MRIEGLVGQQYNQDSGSPQTVRMDHHGALMVSEFAGRYQELCYRGKLFSGSNQAARALSLLSATCTGLCLSNPLGSQTLLVLISLQVALATAPAGAAVIFLAGNAAVQATAVTHTTAETVINNYLSQPQVGVGLVDRASTLPATPTAIRAIGGGPVAASSITPPFIVDDIAGALILGAGTNVSLSSSTTAISTISSVTWAEVSL